MPIDVIVQYNERWVSPRHFTVDLSPYWCMVRWHYLASLYIITTDRRTFFCVRRTFFFVLFFRTFFCVLFSPSPSISNSLRA